MRHLYCVYVDEQLCDANVSSTFFNLYHKQSKWAVQAQRTRKINLTWVIHRGRMEHEEWLPFSSSWRPAHHHCVYVLKEKSLPCNENWFWSTTSPAHLHKAECIYTIYIYVCRWYSSRGRLSWNSCNLHISKFWLYSHNNVLFCFFLNGTLILLHRKASGAI